nr:RNA-directed DNA polymerase, eukaryota, reverse transcriptase zinc-binding domain protein [Tanacetum cinerariifolium]
RNDRMGRRDKYKKELSSLDAVIDSGHGSDVVVNKRLEIFNELQNLDKLNAMDMARKVKTKWAVEGDENTKFFHDNLIDVKKEFFCHFKDRFGKPSDSRATVDMQYPKTIDADQQEDLDGDVSNEEIKKAVWDRGTDKSPGPDGFTFIFYQHYWNTIEKDVVEAVKHFFSKVKIPKGCNSSFIALIPKTHDANMVKDFRADFQDSITNLSNPSSSIQ